MHVHEVQVLAYRHLVLLHGQRQGVRRRLLKQRILDLRDLVKSDALRKAPEPERAGVRDEMDVVPAPRQLQPELGGDGAGAAVGRVAGNANSHAGKRETGNASLRHRARMRSASLSEASVASRVHTFPDSRFSFPDGSWFRN